MTLAGFAIDGAAGAIGVLSSAYLALALGFAARFQPATPRPPVGTLPGLTVLKPLHGDEPRLFEALRSFCTQRYPGPLQIVFGVADVGDPACAVVQRLIDAFPALDLVLVRGTPEAGSNRPAGLNRKVANLLGMLPAARHPVLALSDSDVMLAGSDHLAAVAAELDGPHTGAVTCLYRAWPEPGAASRFAAMHIDHYFLTSALVAQRFGPPDTCYGKLTVVRRDALAAAGGLAALADQVADDAALGWRLRRAGYGVRVSALLVGTVVAETAASLWHHELRWARTVRNTEPVGHAMSLITHALPLVALGALLHPDAVTAAAAGGVLALRTALVWVMGHRLGQPPAPVWRIAGRDAVCFAVWLASYARRTVVWQGVPMTLRAGGLIAPASP